MAQGETEMANSKVLLIAAAAGALLGSYASSAIL
jgi:hypothetical protein